MAVQLDPITRSHLDKGMASLKQEFRGVFSSETIERYVYESLETLESVRFNDFVPLFAHRFARERLRALGQVEGRVGSPRP
jgi:arsenate reductase (thioredoxin)